MLHKTWLDKLYRNFTDRRLQRLKRPHSRLYVCMYVTCLYKHRTDFITQDYGMYVYMYVYLCMRLSYIYPLTYTCICTLRTHAHLSYPKVNIPITTLKKHTYPLVHKHTYIHFFQVRHIYSRERGCIDRFLRHAAAYLAVLESVELVKFCNMVLDPCCS
jgi:hypothetical protein